jgi:hypothetical protein
MLSAGLVTGEPIWFFAVLACLIAGALISLWEALER